MILQPRSLQVLPLLLFLPLPILPHCQVPNQADKQDLHSSLFGLTDNSPDILTPRKEMTELRAITFRSG